MELMLHPKQAEVLMSSATEILFGGAAGPGKSHLLRGGGDRVVQRYRGIAGVPLPENLRRTVGQPHDGTALLSGDAGGMGGFGEVQDCRYGYQICAQRLVHPLTALPVREEQVRLPRGGDACTSRGRTDDLPEVDLHVLARAGADDRDHGATTLGGEIPSDRGGIESGEHSGTPG